MKLKIYRTILLTLLFAVVLLTIGLGVFSFIDLLKKPDDVLDNLVLLLCFVLLIAFIILEIVNTFLSFKTGSVFIKSLVFDDKNALNLPFLVILAIIGLFSIGGLVYALFIISNPSPNLLLGESPLMLKNLLISVFSMLIADISAILLFPVLGKE